MLCLSGMDMGHYEAFKTLLGYHYSHVDLFYTTDLLTKTANNQPVSSLPTNESANLLKIPSVHLCLFLLIGVIE